MSGIQEIPSGAPQYFHSMIKINEKIEQPIMQKDYLEPRPTSSLISLPNKICGYDLTLYISLSI